MMKGIAILTIVCLVVCETVAAAPVASRNRALRSGMSRQSARQSESVSTSKAASGKASASAAKSGAAAAPKAPKTSSLPAKEWKMIREVAVQYDLDEERTWLLASIRMLENGRPGLEFGIGGKMNNGHPSHRYQDGVKSFYVQAQWAAGTIRRNYKGDLYQLGKRYCPATSQLWAEKIDSVMRKLKRENNNRLPGEKPPKREIKFP